ncbi:MAG: helix-turn-helix domain-containing protein [candidate division KSB1 bacterium]|nr:helix-turn-helix domain-containing protein [candidate division KSB1 bacterium]MDZ7335707.1 helix-turn-helix domain-containing protein [candidate division KSB1 bacterium]MDZ7358552.1 helix-turn-helix domain-containing protein [candidate division KSB1 bacterium]MDZ7401642.1 helix-turn-helix domain-containing protein [candidate division KSB1 bacterium]
MILDHELLTVKQAQRLLNVDRCTINELISSGKLRTIRTGSQLKVEGKSVNELLSATDRFDRSFQHGEGPILLQKVSPQELAMISDWT